MLKKTMLLAMAVGAFAALAAPTVASAQTLTDNGKSLKVGAEITATSTNLVTTIGVAPNISTLTCEKVTIHLEVTENGAGSSRAKSKSITTHEGKCDLLTPNKVVDPATIDDATASAVVHLENKESGTTTATFVATLGEPVFATCHAEAAASAPLALSYVTNTDVIHVEGALKNACGASQIHGDFTLETKDATPVIID